MDISAVMNIHDLAMNQTIKQQAEVQERQEKMHEQIKTQEANQTAMMANETPSEAHPAAMTNTVEQQEEPQSAKIRVERQVDMQAAKETVRETEEKGQANAGSQETGTLIDVIT